MSDPQEYQRFIELLLPRKSQAKAIRLARSSGGDVLALGASLATGDVNASPGPVGAGSVTAEDVDRDSIISDRAGDVLDGEAGDGDAVGGGTSGRAVLVILLDDDAVVGDVGEGDAGVGDAGDGSGSVVDGLDADAVGAVLDGGVGDGDGVDGVVVTAADGANGETVAAGAETAGEDDVGAGVDGKAVILVVDGGAGDGDAV